MHVKFHEVLFILRESLEKVWFGGQRVQRRYSLSETTLQQGNFRGMVHNIVSWSEIDWIFWKR